ncbi:MAG: tyrosine-type recombinase/integrase [Verrucomicrobia bacterium]|jgi:integrase/recombinase XerD|nr:tyrosine-type recombinase/integrase [Verrucomicrobiota bacterium]
MTPAEASAVYIEWRRGQHLAENTVRADEIVLRHWIRFCHHYGLGDVREADKAMLLALAERVRHGKSARGPWSKNYQSKILWTVRELFRYLHETERVLSDITLGLPQLHKARHLPKSLMNREQIARLLHQPNLSTAEGFRDRCIFELLYSSGLRGAELCALTPYDLDLPGRVLRVVQGKGRKDRQVPVGKVAAQFLSEYLRQVRPVLLKKKKADGRLFLMGTNVLRQRFRKHREAAHLGDIYTVHSLRHSCATEMLRGGASVRHVQELLGHSSIDTTQDHTRVVIDDLQKTHSRTAPGNRRQESAFIPFNRKTAAWRQDKKRRKKQ